MGEKEAKKKCKQCIRARLESLFDKWVEKHSNYYKNHAGARVVNPWVHYQLRDLETEIKTLADINYDLIEEFKTKI